MSLRVLLQSRATLFSVPGGDTVQVLQTQRALAAAGVEADVSLDLRPDLGDYDLVHCFNLIRPQEVYQQTRNAHRQGRPVALSTIYVVLDEVERRTRRGVLGAATRWLTPGQVEWGKVLARAVLARECHRGTLAVLGRGYTRLRRAVARTVDALLPNSASEAARVARDFDVDGQPVVVVPNGFDPALFPGAPPGGRRDVDVLSVGRIEPRKCQLELVRAVAGLPIRLVLVGKPAPHHGRYYEQVRREAGPNVTLAGHVDHAALAGHYAAARVHALVSWFETTGLSSLEAAAMGCAIVITDKGDARDYFGDRALYCEPDSVASIRAALLRALERPADPSTAAWVRERFTWRHAAARTIEGYAAARAHFGASRRAQHPVLVSVGTG